MSEETGRHEALGMKRSRAALLLAVVTSTLFTTATAVLAALPPGHRVMVIFDVERCLLRRPRLRKGEPFTPIDGGLGGVRARSGETVDLFPGA